MGVHPFKSLPSNSGSASVHAAGSLRLSNGDRTPASGVLVSPRFCTPEILSPDASSSQVVAGRLFVGFAAVIVTLMCAPVTLKSFS